MSIKCSVTNRFVHIQALKEIVEIYKDPLNQEVAYAQLGSFYLFVKKDLIKSLKFYTKAGGENMDSYAMKVRMIFKISHLSWGAGGWHVKRAGCTPYCCIIVKVQN